jgi:hypothetical protein
MRFIRALLFFILTCVGTVRAETAGRVSYVGGTIDSLNAGDGGAIFTADGQVLTVKIHQKNTEIPYDRINLVEYGQNAHRRVGTAIAAYALLGPAGTLVLLSKSRHHFVTIGFRDPDNRQQAMILRVDKKKVRAVLASLEARTGLRVQYQDDEARKAGKG